MNNKLIFILNRFPKLSETFILQELALLKQAGIDFLIISLGKSEDVLRHKYFSQLQNSFITLPKWNDIKSSQLITYFLYSLFNFRSGTIKTFMPIAYKFLKRRNSKVVREFFGAIYIINTLKINKSSNLHFHAQFINVPTRVASNIQSITNFNYSVTAHAKDIYLSSPEDLIRLTDNAIKLKTCTKFNKSYLEQINPKCSEKLSCIYHGIDPSFFQVEEQSQKNKKLSLITIGRLVEKKGYSFLLDVIKKMKDDGIDFTYYIVGEGELRRTLEERIHELGINDNVIMLGALRRTDVKDILSKCHIFLFGTKINPNGDRDGIANSVAEAMAMKLPVISTVSSSIHEIIAHGETGILCPPNDVDSFYKELRKLVENPLLVQSIGENARNYILQNFHFEKCFEECLDFYKTVRRI